MTCGIEDFRWHDLRHTWASWLRQNDVPTWVLQELGGWKSESMVRRYAHMSVKHLQPYSDLLINVPQLESTVIRETERHKTTHSCPHGHLSVVKYVPAKIGGRTRDRT